MRHLLSFFTLCLLAMAPLQAQMPLEGSYTFDKRLAPMANGVTMEMNASYAQIEALLDQKFKAAGAKVKKERKDLYLAQSTVIPSISGRTLDYYYRLEEPSKNQPRPRLTLFLSLGNQNFLSSDMYPQEIEAAKAFLANLDAEARRAAIQAEVTAQTAALNELLKKQASLKEEQTTLEEEKAKLEAALQKNAGAQAQNAEAQQQVQAKVTAEQAKLQKLQQQLEQIQQIGTGQN